MRHILLATAIFISFSSNAQKKPVYEFPAAMAEPVRAEYIKLCDKGQVLYRLNCAKCHNTVVKKKTIIPDFNEDQLKGYEIRVSNAQHEANMPDELVTAEELALISTFLRYKKKNAVTAK